MCIRDSLDSVKEVIELISKIFDGFWRKVQSGIEKVAELGNDLARLLGYKDEAQEEKDKKLKEGEKEISDGLEQRTDASKVPVGQAGLQAVRDSLSPDRSKRTKETQTSPFALGTFAEQVAAYGQQRPGGVKVSPGGQMSMPVSYTHLVAQEHVVDLDLQFFLVVVEVHERIGEPVRRGLHPFPDDGTRVPDGDVGIDAPGFQRGELRLGQRHGADARKLLELHGQRGVVQGVVHRKGQRQIGHFRVDLRVVVVERKRAAVSAVPVSYTHLCGFPAGRPPSGE